LRPACHGYNHSYIREAVERQLTLMPPGAPQVIQQQPYGSVLLGLYTCGTARLWDLWLGESHLSSD
jgi:hypothetical protein